MGCIRAPPGLPPPSPSMETKHADHRGLASQLTHSSAGSTCSEMEQQQHLVWCYEFCHHPENKDRRQLIKKSFSQLNYDVQYLKKAVLFSKWLEEMPDCEYVLVMGWREAQPCLRYIAQTGRTIPALSVIICDGPKQFARASNFALTLSQDVGAVQVCLQDDIPNALHGGLIRQCFGTHTPKEELAPMTTIRQKISLQDELSMTRTNTVGSAASTRSGCSTPTDGGSSSCDSVHSTGKPVLNLHEALVAALENSRRSGSDDMRGFCNSSFRATSESALALRIPQSTRRTGKGKGNGQPVMQVLLADALEEPAPLRMSL